MLRIAGVHRFRNPELFRNLQRLSIISKHVVPQNNYPYAISDGTIVYVLHIG